MVEETMVVKLLQQLVVATAFLPVKVVEDHVAHGVPKLPMVLAGLQTRSRGGDRALCPLLQFSKEMRNKILRHYRKRLLRWCLITAEFLPRNEQALRAREQLRGEAELELSEVPDTRYPEESRVIKLLDGLRLDERATSALLLAAGNKYEMKAVLDASKIQYPAGMSITGLPTLKAAHLKKLGGGSQRRVQHQRRSRAWHAGAWHADADESWVYEAEEHETQQYDETEHAAEDQHEAAYGDVEYDEEDVDGGDATTAEPEHGAQTAGGSSDALSAVVEALTVTSKRLRSPRAVAFTKTRARARILQSLVESQRASRRVLTKGDQKARARANLDSRLPRATLPSSGT